MSNPEPVEGKCNSYPTSDGGYCGNDPYLDDDGEPKNGRCHLHGGKTPTKEENPDVGGQEGNANALKHGVRADPANLYEHLDEAEKNFVDDLHAKYLDIASFGVEDPRNDRLRMTCVMALQEWIARDEVIRSGMTVELTIGMGEGGIPIEQRDGHYLLKVAGDLNQKIRMNLKDLGLLDDPESQKADAIDDLGNDDYDVEVVDVEGGTVDE